MKKIITFLTLTFLLNSCSVTWIPDTDDDYVYRTYPYDYYPYRNYWWNDYYWYRRTPQQRIIVVPKQKDVKERHDDDKRNDGPRRFEPQRIQPQQRQYQPQRGNTPIRQFNQKGRHND